MQPATTSQQALSNLQSFQSSMKNPTDILTQQQQQAGVPAQQQQVSGLRQAITNTTNLLNQIPSGVMGRTQGSLVTGAQANRIAQNESAPVYANLQKENQDYSGAQSDYDRLVQQAQTAANAEIGGQQQQLGNLQSIYSNLFGSEQAKAAQNLEQQKLAEQIREANMSRASNNSLAALLAGGGQNPTPTGSSPSTDPIQQSAYNDVFTRVNGTNDQLPQSNQQLISDYLATKRSADFGNPRDKAKLAIYTQLRPDLFASPSLNYLGAQDNKTNVPAQIGQRLAQSLNPLSMFGL